jgi:hypothetical protein
MTEPRWQSPQPVQPVQQPPAKRRHRWIPWVAYPAVFLVGVTVGMTGEDATAPAASSPEPTATASSTAPAEPAEETTVPSEPAEPLYGEPSKSHFTLSVKTLKKECFGSAGCLVTYRILVDYSGGPTLDPSKTYEVIYEVRGGEDGPVTNTLTVTGTESSVDKEESLSTSSSKAKLTAVVTDVS